MTQKFNPGMMICPVPPRPRILKRRSSPVTSPSTTEARRLCFICNEPVDCQCKMIASTKTVHSEMRLSDKIGQLLGAEYKINVHADDVICKSCLMKFNYLDRLEVDMQSVRGVLVESLSKKYGFIGEPEDDEEFPEPPVKILKPSAPVVDYTALKKTRSELTATQQNGGKLSLVTSSKSQPVIGAPKTQILLKPNEKMFKCLSCDYEGVNADEFRSHTAQCRQVNGLRCRVCKKIFHNQLSLMQHILYQHPSSYTCNLCKIKFSAAKDLGNHMKQCQLSCEKCSYKTRDKHALEEHVKSEHTQKGYMCSVCSVRFDSYEKTVAHAKTHRQNKPAFMRYRCGKCHAVFDARDALVKHIESHRNEQSKKLGTLLVQQPPGNGSHFCHVCSLTFTHKNQYDQHMQKHVTKGKENLAANNQVARLAQNPVKVVRPNSNDNIVLANVVDTSGITFNISIPNEAVDPSVKSMNQLPVNSSVRPQSPKVVVTTGGPLLSNTSTPLRSKGFQSFDAIRLKQLSRTNSAKTLPIVVVEEKPAAREEPDMEILSEFLNISKTPSQSKIRTDNQQSEEPVESSATSLPSFAVLQTNPSSSQVIVLPTRNDNSSEVVQTNEPFSTAVAATPTVQAEVENVETAVLPTNSSYLPHVIGDSTETATNEQMSRDARIDAELSQIFDDLPLFPADDLDASEIIKSTSLVEFDLSFLDSL